MITINDARKKLGDKAETMTDEQIKAILDFLYSLSYRVIEGIVSKGNCAK